MAVGLAAVAASTIGLAVGGEAVLVRVAVGHAAGIGAIGVLLYHRREFPGGAPVA